MFTVKFWGVRGSVPAPLTATQINAKANQILKRYVEAGCPGDFNAFVLANASDIGTFGTYGGNTSCVEVMTNDDHRLVLDMGTGLRMLGMALIQEMIQKKGLEIDFMMSHVHWDHIHGLPFFGPLFVNKGSKIRNRWRFRGGTDWIGTAEACLRGQMDEPTFPVAWDEITALTESIVNETVADMRMFEPENGRGPRVYCRKLNHPQTTYGYRIMSGGRVIAYTTDNEPYNPLFPDPPLLDLARNADVWITDCQYTQDQYEGKVGGPARHGWGHSYPEAVAETAVQANVKAVYLYHHDPAASDDAISAIRDSTEKLIRERGGNTEVHAAWEGLVVTLPDDTSASLIGIAPLTLR